jgi:hypothetical protein
MTNKLVTESLDREGREAVNAVVDALSAWREEVAASTARYSQTVLDKLAAAATAMGWPKSLRPRESTSSKSPKCKRI